MTTLMITRVFSSFNKLMFVIIVDNNRYKKSLSLVATTTVTLDCLFENRHHSELYVSREIIRQNVTS